MHVVRCVVSFVDGTPCNLVLFPAGFIQHVHFLQLPVFTGPALLRFGSGLTGLYLWNKSTFSPDMIIYPPRPTSTQNLSLRSWRPGMIRCMRFCGAPSMTQSWSIFWSGLGAFSILTVGGGRLIAEGGCKLRGFVNM